MSNSFEITFAGLILNGTQANKFEILRKSVVKCKKPI